mmetsp:Transcript_13123/g.40423  ORF Transcript_13123/g.40423 Transcript_13123/m.40423 type:complete len:250 (+) Transcript_13123:73-822(+)
MAANVEKTEAPAPAPTLSFGSFGKSAEGGGGFDFKAPAFGADGSAPLFAAGSLQKFGEAAAPAPAGEGGDDAANPEQESTAEFTPVVQLDEVEVKTHEEDESVEFKMRAKLFRFAETLLNKGSGKKEWIERGVGEIKLFKHRESDMMRVLMRQEKTMKIIVNHVVDPRIELEPNVGSDRSWVWSAWDFSEGELEDTIFAIRFGNAENAKLYKEAFLKAQEHVKGLKDGADGAPSAEADAAAEALAGLKA